MVRNICYILACILFFSNYQICDYFYYNEEVKDISKWWGLKSNIYAVIMLLIFYGSIRHTKGYTRLILSIGLGLCFSNVIDKIFFNVLEFRYNDIIMIVLTVGYSVLDFLNKRKSEWANKQGIIKNNTRTNKT